MSKRDIASLASKFLGVFFIVQGLTALAGTIVYALSSETGVLTYFVYGGWLVAGLILWIGSEGIAGMIFKSDEAEAPVVTRETGVIAFTVLGFYVISRAVPAVGALFAGFYQSLVERGAGQASEYVISEGVTAALLIVLGLWIIKSAPTLSEMLGAGAAEDEVEQS